MERLKQYNRRNNNDGDDDNNPPPTTIFPPPRYYLSSPPKDDSNIEDYLNPTQKFCFGDRPQKEKIVIAVGEKDTVATGEKK